MHSPSSFMQGVACHAWAHVIQSNWCSGIVHNDGGIKGKRTLYRTLILQYEVADDASGARDACIWLMRDGSVSAEKFDMIGTFRTNRLERSFYDTSNYLCKKLQVIKDTVEINLLSSLSISGEKSLIVGFVFPIGKPKKNPTGLPPLSTSLKQKESVHYKSQKRV